MLGVLCQCIKLSVLYTCTEGFDVSGVVTCHEANLRVLYTCTDGVDVSGVVTGRQPEGAVHLY